jgi:type I restriction enzyme, S subunit
VDSLPLPTTLNTGVFVVRSKNNSYLSLFLYYILTSNYFKNFLAKLTAGSTITHLYQKDFVTFSFKIPDIPEQEKIVRTLSDTDELLKHFEYIIKKKKNIKQGMMQELLTGKKRLKGFNEKLEVVTFGDISKIKRGASPRPIEDPKYFGRGRGWVRISDVSKSFKYLEKTRDYLSKLGESQSVTVNEGDVIMSIAATVGRPILVKMEACIHDGFIVFSQLSDDVDPEFLYYILKHIELKLSKSGQQGTQSNINSKLVSKLEFLKPSKKEQETISKILSDMDDEIQELKKQQDKYINLKQGIMQKLLIGEIRIQ